MLNYIYDFILLHKDFINCIFQIITAIGTCSAVIVALYLSLPKKEKANGFFEMFFDNEKRFHTDLKSNTNIPSKLTSVYFYINNKGKTNIIFNYKAGICIKSKEEQIYISLNTNNENDLCIPIGIKLRPFCYTLNFNDVNLEKAKKIYKKTDCTLSVYTTLGTEIVLSKKKK